MLLIVFVSGLGAGALSMLAGQGGGLLALLALSASLGPREALVLTAPGLAVANLHRAALFRRAIDRAVLRRMFAPMLASSIAVGALAARAPDPLLRALLVIVTMFALARALGAIDVAVPPAILAPTGAAIGAFGACSGGAGLLLVPALVSIGLEGEALIGTTQTLALALNGGRLIGYGAGGSLSASLIPYALAMTLALLVGNVLGQRLRRRLIASHLRRVELTTMVVATTLAALGVR